MDGCPIRGVFLLHAQCSWSRLQIHLDQDKAGTGSECVRTDDRTVCWALLFLVWTKAFSFSLYHVWYSKETQHASSTALKLWNTHKHYNYGLQLPVCCLLYCSTLTDLLLSYWLILELGSLSSNITMSHRCHQTRSKPVGSHLLTWSSSFPETCSCYKRKMSLT